MHVCLYLCLCLCLFFRGSCASGLVFNLSVPLSFNLTGMPVTAFSVDMDFGTPPQRFSLIVDTGSSNLAVAGASSSGSAQYYNSNASATGTVTNETFSLLYAVGQLEVARATETISFSESLASGDEVEAEFGSIQSSSDFYVNDSLYHGILGLAYQDIARPAHNPIVPFFETFVNHTGIDDVFAIELCIPLSNDTSLVPQRGTLVLGGTGQEEGLFREGGGEPAYAFIQREWFYAVTVTGMSVGSQRLAFDCGHYNSPSPAIVDSGTTDLKVPQAVFDAIVDTMPLKFKPASVGEEVYAGTRCVFFTDVLLDKLPNITVSVLSEASTGKEFDLTITPRQYFRVHDCSTDEDGPPRIGRAFSIRPLCGREFGMIISIAVMSGYTTIFSRHNRTIGFAPSRCAPSQIPNMEPPHVRVDSSSCAAIPGFTQCSASSSDTNTAILIAIAVVAFVILFLFVVLVFVIFKQKKSQMVRIDPLKA
eukprot:m.68131 g.68131  ORF g.68131 m.68131 type:complete len:478 (+) comp19867_c0_seq2:90-1523(+)